MDDITEQRLLDRAKDDFISIASHEMRTPLTIIRGNASLVREELESGSCGPELLEKVLSIENGSVRLMKIVNDFLDIMRLEGNKIEFRKEKFDFVELTKEVLSELQKAAAKKNLYLKFNEPSDKLPFVVGDKERARQVVTNLTMNAVQYTNQGGIDVAIEKDGRFLRFLVSDTGIGIDKQSHGDLFKKFNTAGKVFVHSKEYGSGLGLYICKLLVEAMDGKVKLEKSEPGVGSTFGFYLQAADQ